MTSNVLVPVVTDGVRSPSPYQQVGPSSYWVQISLRYNFLVGRVAFINADTDTHIGKDRLTELLLPRYTRPIRHIFQCA